MKKEANPKEFHMTPQESLCFSQRSKLEKMIKKWAKEGDGFSDCPLNTVSFLQQKGLLDINKTRDFLKKEK